MVTDFQRRAGRCRGWKVQQRDQVLAKNTKPEEEHGIWPSETEQTGEVWKVEPSLYPAWGDQMTSRRW